LPYRVAAIAQRLTVLPGDLALCRRDAATGLPSWFALDAPFSAALRRDGELTLVAPDAAVPELEAAERGWRALQVAGPLDLTLTGVLASLAQPLADAGVPLFALATVDTDVLLVRGDRLGDAIAALRGAGHEVDAP
jgi:hypothetical protein